MNTIRSDCLGNLIPCVNLFARCWHIVFAIKLCGNVQKLHIILKLFIICQRLICQIHSHYAPTKCIGIRICTIRAIVSSSSSIERRHLNSHYLYLRFREFIMQFSNELFRIFYMNFDCISIWCRAISAKSIPAEQGIDIIYPCKAISFTI